MNINTYKNEFDEVQKKPKNNLLDPSKQGWGQVSINPSYGQWRGNYLQNFTQVIDNLEVMGLAEIKENAEDGEILEFNNDVVLEKLPIGTSMFKSTFLIYQEGMLFGKLHCHPRILNNSLKTLSASLKVNNDILYTEDWHGSLTRVMEGLNYGINNVTKIDIAVDGLNYIPDFLNAYSKQDGENKKIRMVGKARFSAKVLDKERMYYKNFLIGTNKSDKQVTVYLKSSELEISHKEYIRDFWYKNGLRPKEGADVYRVELRLRSKCLKFIRGFNIHACTNPKYLLNLFKTGCHNFFEFTFQEGDKTVNRQTRVKLLPHHYFPCQLLEKSSKPVADGTYKAKMSIHNIVKDILMGHLRNFDANNALGHLKKTISLYRLERWYMRKIKEWIYKYNKLNPEYDFRPELESLKMEDSNTFHL